MQSDFTKPRICWFLACSKTVKAAGRKYSVCGGRMFSEGEVNSIGAVAGFLIGLFG